MIIKVAKETTTPQTHTFLIRGNRHNKAMWTKRECSAVRSPNKPASTIRPNGAIVRKLYKQAFLYCPPLSTSLAKQLIKSRIFLAPRPQGRDWLEKRWGAKPKCDTVVSMPSCCSSVNWVLNRDEFCKQRDIEGVGRLLVKNTALTKSTSVSPLHPFLMASITEWAKSGMSNSREPPNASLKHL